MTRIPLGRYPRRGQHWRNLSSGDTHIIVSHGQGTVAHLPLSSPDGETPWLIGTHWFLQWYEFMEHGDPNDCPVCGRPLTFRQGRLTTAQIFDVSAHVLRRGRFVHLHCRDKESEQC